MDKIKKKAGRPLLDKEKPLDTKLILRISAEDKASWEAKAGKVGQKLSAWIRKTLSQANN